MVERGTQHTSQPGCTRLVTPLAGCWTSERPTPEAQQYGHGCSRPPVATAETPCSSERGCSSRAPASRRAGPAHRPQARRRDHGKRLPHLPSRRVPAAARRLARVLRLVGVRRMGTSSFQWCPVTGQGATGTN